MRRLRRVAIAANIGLALGYVSILIRDLRSPDIIEATDFTVFWNAWHLVLHGRAAALYDEATQRATQKLLMGGGHFEGGLMAFLNPPHFALLTAPFGWVAERFGEQAAFTAWTVGNLALLAVLIRMLWDEWGPTGAQGRALLASAVIAFYPVFVTVKNGQLSLMLVLALFGAYRAARAERPWAAGAWLTVLTFKPQLVPVVVLYLLAAHRWRALVAGALMSAAVVAATAATLGPAVWVEYARHVHYLEQFWGTGTPDYMLNLRGTITRIAGLDRSASIDVAAYAIWLAGLVASAAMLISRYREGQDDSRMPFAFVVAVGLLTNPHLFIHDTLIWAVPLVLATASIRDAGGEWRRFATFALAWPLIFALAGRLDIRSGIWTWFDLHTWTFAFAAVAIARELAARHGEAVPEAAAAEPVGDLQAVELYRSWTS